jgi:hypothetical protein
VKFSRALKAMRNGERVTRRGWSRAHGSLLTLGISAGALDWYDIHDGSYYSRRPQPYRCVSLPDTDILADDWEVVA